MRYLRESSVFSEFVLRKFRIEMFRFKVIQYTKGEYLWKPG